MVPVLLRVMPEAVDVPLAPLFEMIPFKIVLPEPAIVIATLDAMFDKPMLPRVSVLPVSRLLVRVRLAPMPKVLFPRSMLLLPLTVLLAASCQELLVRALAPVRSVEAWRVAPLSHRRPVPKADLLPAMRVPAVSVVRPV